MWGGIPIEKLTIPEIAARWRGEGKVCTVCGKEKAYLGGRCRTCLQKIMDGRLRPVTISGYDPLPSRASVARPADQVGFRCPDCNGEWKASLLAPGYCPHCGSGKPKADWQPKVGERVYVKAGPHKGDFGVISKTTLPRGQPCVQMDDGWLRWLDASILVLEPADQPASLKAPEGVTLRYVGAKEYGDSYLAMPMPELWSTRPLAVNERRGCTNSGWASTLLDAPLSKRAVQDHLRDTAKPGETWLVCPPRDHPLYPKEV